MRKDCVIDNRRVACPNSSTIGYAKRHCKRGDLFIYDNEAGRPLARSLGRVTCEGKSYILAMVLSGDATFAFERWIDPALVREVIDVPTDLAKFFFAKRLPYDAQTMRELMEHGTVSQRYIRAHKARAAAFKATRAA